MPAQFSALPLGATAQVNPYIPGINDTSGNVGFNNGPWRTVPYAGGSRVVRAPYNRGTAAPLMGGASTYAGTPAGGSYSASSGGIGGYGLPGGGGDLMSQVLQMINMQLGENAQAKKLTEQEYYKARDNLLNVPGQLRNDPAFQGARSLAQNLLANPEAITDEVQQKILNRGSNLINASQNAASRAAMGDLAAAGQMGGSAAQIVQDRMQRSRENQLGQMASEAEIQRALRRNEDIRNATQLGQGIAGQQSDVDRNVATTFIQNTPEWKPQDFTGLIAALGLNQVNMANMANQTNTGVNAANLRTLANVGGQDIGSQGPSTYAGMDFNVPGIGFTGGTNMYSQVGQMGAGGLAPGQIGALGMGNTVGYGALGGGSIPGLQGFNMPGGAGQNRPF